MTFINFTRFFSVKQCVDRGMGPHLHNFLTKCLCPEPNARLSARDLLKLDFIQKSGESSAAPAGAPDTSEIKVQRMAVTDLFVIVLDDLNSIRMISTTTRVESRPHSDKVQRSTLLSGSDTGAMLLGHGQNFAIACDDGTVEVWNVSGPLKDNCNLSFVTKTDAEAEDGQMLLMDMCSSHFCWLQVSSTLRTVELTVRSLKEAHISWKLQLHKETRPLPFPRLFNYKEGSLLTVAHEKSVMQYKLADQPNNIKGSKRFYLPFTADARVTAIEEFKDNSDYLWISAANHTVQLVDMPRGSVLKKFQTPPHTVTNLIVVDNRLMVGCLRSQGCLISYDLTAFAGKGGEFPPFGHRPASLVSPKDFLPSALTGPVRHQNGNLVFVHNEELVFLSVEYFIFQERSARWPQGYPSEHSSEDEKYLSDSEDDLDSDDSDSTLRRFVPRSIARKVSSWFDSD